MCHQVHYALYHSGHKWQNYDSPYSGDFTLYPFKIILVSIQAHYGMPFGNFRAGCTCFKVSPASCNSFSVIVTTKWSMTLVPISTGTLSHIYDWE